VTKTNRRRYPLRKVMKREYVYDYLECGHILPTPTDIIGNYYPESRRCHKCAKRREKDWMKS